MKKFFYILLLSISACSPDNDHELIEGQSTSDESLESMNLEADQALNRDSSNLIYTETFENPDLDSDPQAGDFYMEYVEEDHSFQLEENIKREGSNSGRFEIRKNDPQIYGGHRTELVQSLSTTQSEGWYGFSQYFPSDYGSDDTGDGIGQWHDIPDSGEATNRPPSNALLASNDRLKWIVRWDADRIMTNGNTDGIFHIDLGQIPKNRWVDWVVHIKYAHNNTGILEVWMDGKKVINRQNMPNAYNDQKYPYFKFGVYKWNWGNSSTKRVIYYDEVRVGNKNSSYDEVKPTETNNSSEINMMVNSYTVDCYGEREGTCLLVQERDLIGSEDWEYFYFYNNIEGFTYEPGFVYGLTVKKTEVKETAAGASSIKYELVKIVSKEKQ